MTKKSNFIQLSISEQKELFTNLQSKSVLTTKEAAIYLSMSVHYLRRIRKDRKIISYQPNGKKVYFKRQDLDDWMLSNRQSDNKTIGNRVSNYLLKSKF